MKKKTATKKKTKAAPKIKPLAFADGVPVWCVHSAIVPIADLKPHPRNPNRHPAKQIGILEPILKRGWRKVITVSNRSGFITAGEGRYLAAKKAKLKEVPVDYQDYETDLDEIADLVADNKTSEMSYVDIEALYDIMEDQTDDMEIFGFDEDEFDELILEKNLKEGGDSEVDSAFYGDDLFDETPKGRKPRPCPHCGKDINKKK